MNKTVFKRATRVTLFITVLFLTLKSPNVSHALIQQSNDNIGDFYFPLPYGTVSTYRGLIPNGHNGYDLHQYHGNRNSETEKNDPNNLVTGSCLEYGVPILAAENGVVELVKQSGFNGGAGTYVKIKNSNGVSTVYMHMVENGALAKVGDAVKTGQIIGLMGSTGSSHGKTCTIKKENPLTGKLEDINVSGVHLHFEIRKFDGKKMYAHHANSFIGGKIYKSLEKGTYQSITRMIDPNGYWQKYGYRYDYVLPKEAMDGANPYSTKINSITPLTVRAGERTTFTINGEILPQDLEVQLGACEGGIEWVTNENGRRDMEKQQFRCTINRTGRVGGSVIVPNIKIDGETMKMGFELDVLAQDEVAPPTKYTGYPTLPKDAEPGDKIILTINGKNMPGDLSLNMPACSRIRYLSRTSRHQTIECTISPYIYNEDGRLKSELMTHEVQVVDAEGEIVAQSEFVVDHRLQIESIEPATTYFGRKTSFTIKGKGVHNLKAFHLDECRDLVALSQSDIKNQVVIQCTLPMPEEFFSPLMPASLKRKTLNFYVKEKKGGQLLLAGKIEALAAPDTWVERVIPYYPTLGEEEQFTIRGKELPDKLLYWMGHCGHGELTPRKSNAAQFDCTPAWIGGNEAKKSFEKAAQSAQDDPEVFVKEVEKQRRILEVKYPRELSTDGQTATVIYRGSVLPLPRDYVSLYLDALDGVINENAPSALWLDETDNEEIIRYILENKGKYSNTFLKKVGWEKSAGFYQILTCSGRSNGPFQPYLNVDGVCAQNLEYLLIGEDVKRLYPLNKK